jgi:hypothetical protein
MSDPVRLIEDGFDLPKGPWDAGWNAAEVNSPDFGMASPAPTRNAAFDPNTGLWWSDVVHRAGGDGLTIEQREPWKPPYRWRSEPIKRLRVEWARWRARRG